MCWPDLWCDQGWARNRETQKVNTMAAMDAIDRKILALVQENAAQPVAEIARKVGLSVTPCWRRIQRLEESGVIRKRVALLDGKKIGVPMSVFVALRTEVRQLQAGRDGLQCGLMLAEQLCTMHAGSRCADDILSLLRTTPKSPLELELPP